MSPHPCLILTAFEFLIRIRGQNRAQLYRRHRRSTTLMPDMSPTLGVLASEDPGLGSARLCLLVTLIPNHTGLLFGFSSL